MCQSGLSFCLFVLPEKLGLFRHCCFRELIFHRLRHKNKLVNQIVKCHRVISFACGVIFMIFRWRRLQTLSRLHDASMPCSWNLVGFTTLHFSFLKAGALLCSFLARHCRLHWNFHLSPCVCDGFFVFFVIQIDKINASQPSSTVEFWLLVLPILAFLSSERLFNFSSILQATHSQVWQLLHFFGLSPDHMYPLGDFSFNRVNFGEALPRIW